ncbi:MAG: hypothetical protein SGPRY_008744 [Prymnesium sp.]
MRRLSASLVGCLLAGAALWLLLAPPRPARPSGSPRSRQRLWQARWSEARRGEGRDTRDPQDGRGWGKGREGRGAREVLREGRTGDDRQAGPINAEKKTERAAYDSPPVAHSSYDAAPPLTPSPSEPRCAPFGSQSPEAARIVAIARSQRLPQPGDPRRGGYDNMANVRRESETVRRLMREDGLSTWRPDPSLLPPQVCASASMSELLTEVPINGTAWLSFGNSGVSEMLMNWAYHVLKLGKGKEMVVAAYDNALFDSLRALRIPTYNLSGALPDHHFRGTPFLFHRMGFLKAMTIAEVLSSGRRVLVSDSDVVWLRDPSAELNFLAAHVGAVLSKLTIGAGVCAKIKVTIILLQGASIAPSTDCLDTEEDNDKTPRQRSAYLCGHSPGNVGGTVFNTGVIFMASQSSTVGFCHLWANCTLQLVAEQWWSDDQGVFNALLTGPQGDSAFYPIRSAGLDGRLIQGRAHSGLTLAPLPAERYCSGASSFLTAFGCHLVWVQQSALPFACVSVHATFTEFGDAGKRWRMMEAGMWGPLPPTYFSLGRYITFTPPQPMSDPAPCKPGEGIRLHALRDALAIARVLNRTLILPHFWCLCDRSELVDFIPSCVFPGAPPAMRFPFKASVPGKRRSMPDQSEGWRVQGWRWGVYGQCGSEARR